MGCCSTGITANMTVTKGRTYRCVHPTFLYEVHIINSELPCHSNEFVTLFPVPMFWNEFKSEHKCVPAYVPVRSALQQFLESGKNNHSIRQKLGSMSELDEDKGNSTYQASLRRRCGMPTREVHWLLVFFVTPTWCWQVLVQTGMKITCNVVYNGTYRVFDENRQRSVPL